MHGEKVLFAEKRSEKKKFNTPTKFVIYPNLTLSSFYSRVLDMKILCRVSKTALWTIEQEYAGFDEYILTAPDEYFSDYVARMYREEIRTKFEEQKHSIRSDTIDALKIHGKEYVRLFQQLYSNHWLIF